MQYQRMIGQQATSAELGLAKQNKSQIRINQCKYESSLQDMLPKRDDIYKYRRRPSPTRNQSKRDLLSHSVDFIKPPHVERDCSFNNFHKKTSQSGFYKRPQVSISLTRMKENEAANRMFDYSNKENEIYNLISKQIQRNPITGNGLPNQCKTGIKCNTSKRSHMDEILFQGFEWAKEVGYQIVIQFQLFWYHSISSLKTYYYLSSRLSKYYINQIMHKILFENKLSTQSPFSPFGSSKNSKPGIITKIKNRIQDLFQPSIKPASSIQRIQCYNDQNLDKELSYQFKNNLVIVDHIIPNKEYMPTLKRKSLYPFDQYLKELDQNQNQISDEAIINQQIQQKDQEPQLPESKQQMMFKKNHAKNQKSRKMEGNSQKRDFLFNKKSLNLNDELKQENSSGFLSNHSIKKIKCSDNTIEIASPSQKEEQSNGQMSQINQFEIQSIAIIKQNQQIGCQQLSDQKNRISETQNRHSCNIVNFKQFIQENQYFSSSTGTNTKGETQEAIFNMEHISFSQETDSSISEDKYSNDNSLEIQNKLYSIFHPDFAQKGNVNSNQDLEQNKTPEELKNNQILDKNQLSNDILESSKQIKKQRNLRLQSEIISLSIQCNPQTQNKNQNQILQSEVQFQQDEQKCQTKSFITSQENSCDNHSTQNVFLSNPSQKQDQEQIVKEQNKNQIQQQQLQSESIFQKELKFIDDKLDSPQSQNTLLSMNCESTIINSNIIQENDKPKEMNMKSNQILKENNPFLETISNISQDQFSQYFQQALLTGNSQNHLNQQQITKDQNQRDLFKMQTNNQLFDFNVLVENQDLQVQNDNLFAQQYYAQKNDQCQNYNKMEIIDQILLPDQSNLIQQNIYQQPYQIYYSPPFDQKFYCQPATFQQSQPSIPWVGYQSPISQQTPYPQMQQSSFQISSINLFQSNSSMVNSNPNCCQEENPINHIYTKQDVLSFFQDPNKKQDQNLFTLDSNQNSNTQAQNLNNSFTRGYKKKQRINNS
ncbi:unnamed protein product (macronuclear) [Paramecium tetraurelia]|uniref:Uncharacterized protein n=1 Tax=Paramecium tetraurelia TaxID=5888 RepID=A0DV44_PARTE|nr:uncharacterized protein GSPATT00020573001 [Paramecium tetraurelia]CAK86911.1 unnamed protein product [Paramecium tetraurelia]|eukprot:XP_001454308.1 hypothetical protein (macronuclear) [Paramecium tetraurelia strain d4-2]